ncbi:MAG TPA: hypothetical protein VMX17_12650 [Candidatus Glassbacteria bacterium]|nr:hypothetical protein [Candidatus Glassbacteria bacterium]
MLRESQENIPNDKINKKESVISDFQGLEETFSKFVNSLEEEKLNSKNIKGILHVFPSHGKLHALVMSGLKLSQMDKKIKYEMKFIEDELRKQAKVLVMAWNAMHNDEVSSVRFVPSKDEQSALVSERKAYSIDKDKILDLKSAISEKDFNNIFDENSKFVLKNNNMRTVLFGFLQSMFGEHFMKAFFDEEITIKVNHKALTDYLNDNNVSDNVKTLMNRAVTRHEPSIKYSK